MRHYVMNTRPTDQVSRVQNSRNWRWILTLLPVFLLAGVAAADAVPAVSREAGRVVVTGTDYRVSFTPEMAGFTFQLKTADGKWCDVAEKESDLTLALFDGGEHSIRGQRATWAIEEKAGYVAVGQQAVLRPDTKTVLDLHLVCLDEGMLIGTRLSSSGSAMSGHFWCPPRIRLAPDDWDRYVFWGPDGDARSGRLADLDSCPAYAGVSAWEQKGDTVSKLCAERPAIAVLSQRRNMGLGVVFVDYARRWSETCAFIQRHTPSSLYLYGGYSKADAASDVRWAWLAPLSNGDASTLARHVEGLVSSGEQVGRSFQPVSQPVPGSWLEELAGLSPQTCGVGNRFVILATRLSLRSTSTRRRVTRSTLPRRSVPTA